MKIIKISLLAAATISSLTAATNLEKVVVTTPNKTAQFTHNITTNIDLITSDEIEDRGFKTLSDALKSHSGIVFGRNGGLGKVTSVMLRGFDSKRVLVLIDGVRYNDPTSLSGASFEHILLDSIDRIEIVKGAQSGIWGSDASAGVINIITKKASKDETSATIHAEYGSFNTQTYGINTAFKKDKLDLSLNLERLTSDGFSAKVADGKKVSDFEDDEYENSTANLKLGYSIDDQNRVSIFYNYIDSDSDFDGYLMDQNFKYDPTASANDKLATSSSTQKFYGASYERFGSNYSAKLYYQKSDFQRLSKVAPSSFSDGKSRFDGSIDESGLDGVYKIDDAIWLGAGVDYKRFKHDNKLSNSITNQGEYISINDKVSEDLGDTLISATLRYDKFDEFDNKITYRLGLKHTPSSNRDLSIFANYSTGYNIPTIYQLFDTKVGNKDVNPEETRGYDVGFNYDSFSFSYFDNTIEDLIDYKVTDPSTYKGAYYNLEGDSDLKGVELSYNSALEEYDLSYGFNYTYLKTKDSKGKELPRRPKNSANVSIDYYGVAQTHLGALVSYVGDRKKSLYDENPTVKYDSYTIVDLVADYDLNSAFNIYAKIDNALDKEYENISGYGVSERAYYLGFRYKVK